MQLVHVTDYAAQSTFWVGDGPAPPAGTPGHLQTAGDHLQRDLIAILLPAQVGDPSENLDEHDALFVRTGWSSR